jgi:hexosaminidase
MPLPAQITPGSGRLPIDAGFHLVADACPASAIARLQSRIAQQTGMPMTGSGAALVIHCGLPAPDWPTLGEDESYTLDVTPSGATLTSATATGALRGMETFAQSIDFDASAGFGAPAVHIEDRPRYPWRGLMMDVSRHWMPVDVVERNLEAMAAVKLNVFHWHLSDDQGFRVESKLYPELQAMGSDGNFYTQDQIREVVAFARDRGIRVVPEFDMPGHTTSWFVGMPELAAAPGPYQIARTWGISGAVMNAAGAGTYTFLDAFLGEMAALFPDQYWHIGGDEVQDPTARTLQPQFNVRLQALLEQHGKSVIGWDDILAPGLASSTIIQSWRGPNGVVAAAGQGYRAVLSYGYYLDYLYPAAQHYAVDPGDASNVLGGEACMWAEYVSSQTVDSRIWPRLAAIAERFWSPRNVTDLASLYQRLEPVSEWLEWTGLQHRASYLAMLFNISGGQPLYPVQVLADASEATGISVRSQAHQYTSLTPLDRLVDAARPESQPVYQLELAALRRSPVDLALLRLQFAVWVANDAQFQPMVAGSAYLPELVPLSSNLKTVGQIGLEALTYLQAGQPAPIAWLMQAESQVIAIQRPLAEVVLAAARPVQILLEDLRVE